MLTKIEEQIVSKYVDEFIDGLRLDVVVFDGTRVITEQLSSKIIIVDQDFLIDNSREYEVFLRNPVEDYFFIPKEIDYYETKIVLEFDRKDSFKITNFIDVGVSDSYSVAIDDPSVTDNCLSNLLRYMCFDISYQKIYPEVKIAIDEYFSNTENQDSMLLKKRIGDFLGI